jgi:drug/metabolite transporter (DMT)-like permease
MSAVKHLTDVKVLIVDSSIHGAVGSYSADARGETMSFQIGHDATVRSIKLLIADDFAADPSQLDLSFAGYACTDDAELADSLGVRNGSLIECTIVRARKSSSLVALVNALDAPIRGDIERVDGMPQNALTRSKFVLCGIPLIALVANIALLTTQVIFGIGSVVGKVGISAHNPVLFALVREGLAGPILVLIALILTREVPRVRDMPIFLVAGVAIYANQLGYIVGLALSDATTGSAWQPTQPIFVSIIAMTLRMEDFSFLKVIGVLAGFAGCAFMCIYGSSPSSINAVYILGNVCFFINCFGTAIYVLVSKMILSRCRCNKPELEARVAKVFTISGPIVLGKKATPGEIVNYSSITVTGWSYIIASVFMLITTVIVNSVPPALAFVCTSKKTNTTIRDEIVDECVANAWKVPVDMIIPLAYWIIFNSVAAYALMTWANKHVNPSVTSIYTVLQPLTSAVLSTILLIVLPTWAKSKGLIMPGLNALGIIGIVIGLAVVLYANQAEKTRKKKKKLASEKERALLDHASA